jgi:hypothetical protein
MFGRAIREPCARCLVRTVRAFARAPAPEHRMGRRAEAVARGPHRRAIRPLHGALRAERPPMPATKAAMWLTLTSRSCASLSAARIRSASARSLARCPADPHLGTLDRLRDGRMTEGTGLCRDGDGRERLARRHIGSSARAQLRSRTIAIRRDTQTSSRGTSAARNQSHYRIARPIRGLPAVAAVTIRGEVRTLAVRAISRSGRCQNR